VVAGILFLISALFHLLVKNVGDKLYKQRINVKFLVELDKNVTDIYKILQQVYGDETMRTWIFVG
jgi:hypothetical protein